MASAARSQLRTAFERLCGASRAVRITVVAVFLLSLAVRLVVAAAATPVLVSDARDYHVLAQNLAAGRGYMQVYEGETDAFNGFTFRAFRPPGYPVFLAGLSFVFGWGSQVYLGANIGADLVTELCGLLIAVHLFGVGAGLFTQILLAAHVLWTPNPMTESLHTALFCLLALLLVLGSPLRSWRAALLFGFVAAAALFVRPVTICVFPALAWRFVRSRPRWRGTYLLGLALLPTALGLTAWSIRNYRLFGEFVPFTTNLGHHNAYDYNIPADWEFARLRAAGLNEAQINRELVRLERERAQTYPRAWLITCVERALELFSLTPAWEVENVLWAQILNPEASVVGRIYRASYQQYYVTYALAACGAIVLALQRRGLAGVWSLMLAYVLIHALLSRGDIRLAAPLYPLMCVLAGAVWMTAQQALHPAVARMPLSSARKTPRASHLRVQQAALHAA